MSQEEKEIFEIPRSILDAMVSILASLPYSQVGQVMAAISRVVGQQQMQPKPKAPGKRKGFAETR